MGDKDSPLSTSKDTPGSSPDGATAGKKPPTSGSGPSTTLTEKDVESIAELMLQKFKEKGKGSPPSKDDDSDPPAVCVIPSLPKDTVTLAVIVKDSSLKTAADPKEKAKDTLVYICDGIPPLPTKVVQSIEKGEFIDFTSLLPRSASWEEDPFMEITEKVVVFTQGKAVPKKKSIESIETWMEAFCTYAAVRGRKHPEDIPELMAYAATIVKGARDYGGRNWLAYDYRFRQVAAAKQMKRGWGQKDMALWNDTFLRPKPNQNDRGKGAADRQNTSHSQKRGSESAQGSTAKKQKKSVAWRSHADLLPI